MSISSRFPRVDKFRNRKASQNFFSFFFQFKMSSLRNNVRRTIFNVWVIPFCRSFKSKASLKATRRKDPELEKIINSAFSNLQLPHSYKSDFKKHFIEGFYSGTSDAKNRVSYSDAFMTITTVSTSFSKYNFW